MAESPALAVEPGTFVSPNFMFENSGGFNLKKKPVTKFKIVWLSVKGQGLPCVINAVVERLNVGVGEAFQLQLVDVLLGKHNSPSSVKEVAPVDEVHHPSSTGWLL